jgi:mevalonate kinase
MSSFDFQTTTHGKWILAGEHSVLRGHGALVFPIASKKLTLRYSSASSSLSADFEGQHGETMHLLFWSVLEHGLRLLNRTLNQIKGTFLISNSIQIGVGMGASAALCVAVTRWFVYEGWLAAQHEFTFAKSLEDLFHGKSSGLDIVGVSAQSGMFFQQGTAEPILQRWQPKWGLSFSGQQGLTSPCIARVHALWEDNPRLAAAIDERMEKSVYLAKQALADATAQAKSLLIESMETATRCFEDWGLMSETVSAHFDALKKLGAIAIKPTGSGGGGYVLSLWNEYPAQSDNLLTV